MSALSDYIRSRVAGCVRYAIDEARQSLDSAAQRTAREPFNEHPRVAIEALGRGLQAATLSLGSALEELHAERVGLVARGNRMASALECILADKAPSADEMREALSQWRELSP